MFDTAMKSTSASNTSFSRTLDNLAKNITGPNNTNKTADSTIVGSGTIADDRPATDMYGNPIIYLPDGTEQRTT
jgi:hypothetical protein